MNAKLLSTVYLAFAVGAGGGQAPALDQAYEALRGKAYDRAILLFKKALSETPSQPKVRKDLAYTFLKTGQTEAARDEFAEILRVNPADIPAALEFAFLCNETGQVRTARRTFDRIRKTGNVVAEQAFQNIDQPLADGIARWQKALTLSPMNFSAHEELARLAEQRDALALAAEHYERAWRLRPDVTPLLVALGRVWGELGRSEDANAALLSASRARESRVAETARELLPDRYPYVYEFQKALALDPRNVDLRRELAFLHLEMGKREAAEAEFRTVHVMAPQDHLASAQLGFLLLAKNDLSGAMALLDVVLKSGDAALIDRVRIALRVPPSLRKQPEPQHEGAAKSSTDADDPKSLGERSYRAGYLKDALKYLTIAHERDPNDYGVMLQLGWTLNMLREDKQAMGWFAKARSSPDAAIANEASHAYRNLRSDQSLVRITAWTFPFYSARWKDLFSYSQIKGEFRLGSLPIRPYLSMRLIGDTRGAMRTDAVLNPQYLSESSIIAGAGVRTNPFHGMVLWAEAGEAMRYRNRTDVGRMIPDYRGGVAFGKGFGHALGAERNGWFFETSDDGVFVSRFNNDFLLYSQNHLGWTFGKVQFYWSGNVTVDLQRQYWANYLEHGPGIKLRLPGMPPGLSFTVQGLRGRYTVQEGNPRGPVFTDLRAGLWYAFTH